MRILLIITCVASLAPNEAWAQVAAMGGMGLTNMRSGESTANIGAHSAMRGPLPGMHRSYGSNFAQNNNTALDSRTTASPVASSTLSQPLMNPNQRMVFHGGTMVQSSGVQRTMFQGGLLRPPFQGNAAQNYNPARRLQYGGSFGEFSGLPPDGMGNINIQVAQSPQTPAAMQAAQHYQTPATIQTAQSSQIPAAFNVQSGHMFHGWQNGVLGNGVYGNSMYRGGYPLNNGVQVRTY